MKGLVDRLSGMFRSPRAPTAAPGSFDGASATPPDIQAGIRFHQAGQLREAEAVYRRILAVDPRHADALHLLGVVAQQTGDSARAVELMTRSLAIEPANSAVLCNVALAFRSSSRLDEAEVSVRRAVALTPDSDRAQNILGMITLTRGGLDQAESCFRRAVELNPANAEALANLGSVCKDKGDLEQAEGHYRRALALNPNIAATWNNLGAVMQQRGDFAGARDCYQRALTLRPDDAGAHNNLGSIALMERMLPEAEASFRTALRSNPDDASASYNLSMVALLRGDYEQGLPLYESRFDALPHEFANARAAAARLRPEARWRGGSLAGKRILVWTEQGLGDSLMMMRYLPGLKERGARSVTVVCDPALHRVMRSMRGVDDVVASTDGVSAASYDAHCPIMSLPYGFGTRRDTIPGPVPYLHVPESAKAAWRERLSLVDKRRVGLVWAGNSALRDDGRRSIPVEQFGPLARVAGIQLISLQKVEAAERRAESVEGIIDWMSASADFMDTAALIDALDLVVSVDTAVAHLAGALGKPVWLLNRVESEWRWGLEGETTPWYPTMRIFRQERPYEWGGVIDRVARELGEPASP